VTDSDKTFPNPLGYVAPKRLMDLYEREKVRLRPNASATQATSITPARSLDRVREDYHGHYALCTGIDEQFGRLVAKLKALDRYDDTVIVYTSDHGDLLGSHGRPWAKSFPEDESVRVPLVIRWPRAARASCVSDLLVGTLDIMPTVLGMLGLDAPDTCDGRDLSGAIRNGDDDAVESVPLFYFCPDWRGVLTKRYTYAFERPGSSPDINWNVLYDRRRDPFQQTNRFHDPEYAEVKADLHQLACDWLVQFDDDIVDGQTLMTEICGLPAGNQCRPGLTGELPGRPIDLIRAMEGAK
jgi:arylsulfatase A-like enzyme